MMTREKQSIYKKNSNQTWGWEYCCNIIILLNNYPCKNVYYS